MFLNENNLELISKMHTSVVTLLKPHFGTVKVVTSGILKPSQVQVTCLVGQKGPYFRYSSSLENARDTKFTCQGWIKTSITFTGLNPLLLKSCHQRLQIKNEFKITAQFLCLRKSRHVIKTNDAASVQCSFESTSFRFISCETSRFFGSLLTLT